MSGKKILVVDDDASIRELLRHKLELNGFLISTAKNEKEFLTCVAYSKPDLIILDIWLKNKIGTEIHKKMVQEGFDPNVPVIFITALESGYPKEPTPNTDGRKFALYSKPFDFDKLLEEIEHLLTPAALS